MSPFWVHFELQNHPFLDHFWIPKSSIFGSFLSLKMKFNFGLKIIFRAGKQISKSRWKTKSNFILGRKRNFEAGKEIQKSMPEPEKKLKI